MVEGRKLDATATAAAAKLDGAGVGQAEGASTEAAAVQAPTGQKAFDDVTDLKNEEFIYVY
jgi:hypothetical protein